MDKICKNCGNNSGIEAFTGNIKCISSEFMAKTEPSVNEDTGEVYYSLDKIMGAVPCIYFSIPTNEKAPKTEIEPKEVEKEPVIETIPDTKPEKKEEIKEAEQPPSDQITMKW